MSKHINKEEVRREADAYTCTLNTRVADLRNMQRAANEYVIDTVLSGAAYKASKDYISTFYIPMYTGLINACAEMAMTNTKLKTHLNTVLGDDINVNDTNDAWLHHLDRERHFNIEANRESQRITNTLLAEVMKQHRITHLRNQARFHGNMAKELKRVLDSIEVFEIRTGGIYNRSNEMFALVESVQKQLNSVLFNTATQRYMLPDGLRTTMSQLIEMNADAVDSVEGRLYANGNYDWDLIGHLLQSDPKHLTHSQLTALTNILLSADCVINVNKFIDSGYTLVEVAGKNPEYLQTPVFKIVSEKVLSVIAPEIMKIESSGTSFNTETEKLKYIKYYELQNENNRRVMNSFLEPISEAGLSKDILEIKFISYRAPEPYKDLMFMHLSDISIVDNKTLKGQHYKRKDHAISVYFDNLKSDNDYLTFFHEIGHAIDYAMGADETYISQEIFEILEEEVFENIENRIRHYSENPANIKIILETFKYDGDPSELRAEQRDIYDDVLNEYLKIFNTNKKEYSQNKTASVIFGGFTENAVIINPITNKRIGRGHDLTENTGYYFKDGNPTGAQNKELFADHIAINILQETDVVNVNSNFFSTTVDKMNNLIENELIEKRG
ncbi:MAG: hypothetical protein LBD23_07920 [Oscillospiraceae bacterium]|jgi:hypothetical protein|nr:hypothetical protein [Oscillospiraceae bacterium]